MRELLDLAIDKGVRRFVERARVAGFTLPRQPDDDQGRFEEEIEDFR